MALSDSSSCLPAIPLPTVKHFLFMLKPSLLENSEISPAVARMRESTLTEYQNAATATKKDAIKKLLDEWKQQGYIKGSKDKKDGTALVGIEIKL